MAQIDKSKKTSRWYFGGLASAGAACVTHPLDLLKVSKKYKLCNRKSSITFKKYFKQIQKLE